jgi:hypothetical protein
MRDIDIDRIVTEYLFKENGEVFDAIACDDVAYELLSNEHVIMIITKKMMETEN